MANASARHPVLFLSHGSPTLALQTPESDPYVATLRDLWLRLEKPKAVVFVSAHWYVNGKFVDVAKNPKTIYDFYGFPDALSRIGYGAPWYPSASGYLDEIFGKGIWTPVERGLDHGVWTTLMHLFPNADVPVATLSVDAGASPEEHFDIWRGLRGLRDEGFLVICSGNVVHDLASVDFSRWPESEPYQFAKFFDEAFKAAVDKGDVKPLFHPEKMAGGTRSVPTPDHYLPAIVALGSAFEGEKTEWLFEGFELWSISRRAFGLGLAN